MHFMLFKQRMPHCVSRYLQLDSWWYPKDAVKAVLTWTPMANIFPNGIKLVSIY